MEESPRRQPGLAWLVFGVALAAYLRTLSPSLAPGHDSGELTAAAATMGIAHPPGYPLYTLLGHAFSRLPAGDPAFRLNLLSALCVAAAAGLSAAAFGRLARAPYAGAAAALCWAFALTPWRLSAVAEVFGLHLALLAALLLLASLWAGVEESGRRRLTTAGAFVAGLGLAHHHTLVLAVVPLALYGWMSKGARGGGFVVGAAGALAAGLAPYLYLPLRAAASPALNWGDPSSPARFLAVVTRSGYGSVRLSTQGGGAEGAVWHLEAYLRSLLLVQFPWGLAALGLAGAAVGWRRNRAAVALLGSLWLLFGPAWAALTGQPPGEGYADMMERFYASSYLGFAGLMALALGPLEDRLRRVAATLPAALLALALVPAVSHYSGADLSGQTYAADALRAGFQAVPEGGVLVLGSDLTAGSALYLHEVEGERRDLDLVFPGLLQSDWYRAQLPGDLQTASATSDLCGFLAAVRSSGRDVYIDSVPACDAGFFVPEGIVYRYLAPGEPLPDRAEVSRSVLDRLASAPRFGDYRLHKDQPFWVRWLLQTWAFHLRTAAEGLAEVDPEAAARGFEAVEAIEGSKRL